MRSFCEIKAPCYFILFVFFSDKKYVKKRKESDIYLATFHRHHWSAQMTMKKDNLMELSASTVAFIS